MGLALVAGSRTGAVKQHRPRLWGQKLVPSYLSPFPLWSGQILLPETNANQPTLATARAIAASLDAFWRRIDQHVSLDGRPTWKHGK
jgi:hypothetical protein